MAKGLAVNEVNEHLRGRSVPTPTLMTIEEVAADWRVNRSTVWRKIKSGELPVVRIGGRTLIRRTDKDAFIARCLEGAA